MKTTRYLENRLIIFLSLILRTVAFPFLLLYFLGRIARHRAWLRKLAERFGALPASFSRTPPGSVWLHAVSVGEILSAVELLKQISAAQPYAPLYVSTTTLAGRKVADEKLRGLAAGVFYLPIDYGFAIRRVLRTIRPNVVVILETELWPTLFRTVAHAGCALLIVNGRISDRAWPRYRRFRWYFRHLLQCPQLIAVQTQADRQRYLELGAPLENVAVIGNLKYDASPNSLAFTVNATTIWIAASVDIEEFDAVISAFQQLIKDHPGLFLILAPRKPDHFATAASKLEAAAIPYQRRSANLVTGTEIPLPKSTGTNPQAPAELRCPSPNCAVLLLDTIGELNAIFPLADIVFMGGTLANRGGHNILEPAAAAKPIVIGPHMENFAEIAAEFRAAEALIEIDNPAALAPAIHNLLINPSHRTSLGSRARDLAQAKRGATAKAVDAIVNARDLALPNFKGRGAAYPVLALLALLWKAGNAHRERSDMAHVRALRAPVVSVGGIGMGGAGKTPVALFLARRLAASGLRPAILTRGYGRKSSARAVIVPAGCHVGVDQTGDEAQIFVREGRADTGISADRYQAGRLLEDLTHPDIFILDDGFQHRRLKRNCNLILIDSLDPFAGGTLFPAGRLREPLTALARADAFLITRAEPGRDYAGIRGILARYNPAAPVFHSRVQPAGWVDLATGQPAGSLPGPVVAFCGIGNPHSFWQTLRDMGIEPAFAWAFGDHHAYSTRELQRLAQQAHRHGSLVLLTTLKDSHNLPPHAIDLVAPLRILWLDIEAQVFEEEELIEHILNMSV